MTKGGKGERNGKTPTIDDGIRALGKKVPTISVPTIEGRPLAWRFSNCDKEGPFAWPKALICDDILNIFERIHEFEQKTWNQLIDLGCHPIECWQLGDDARNRLQTIFLDDLAELMSFRLSGTQRIWCVKDANIMRVLWWDPEHKVYPVKKDKADRKKDRKKRG